MIFSVFERHIAYRYLRSPRQEGFISVIAWFSLIGISLGVATLIIVMSVMNGFREELLTRIIGMNGHMLILPLNSPSIEGYNALTHEIEKLPGIQHVYPEIDRQAIMMFSAQARGVQVHGVRPEDLKSKKFIRENIVAGSLEDFNLQGSPNGLPPLDTLSIGEELARRLNVHVGDRISMMNPDGPSTAFGTLPKQKSFYISSIFKSGVHAIDSNVAYMPLTSAQTFFKIPDGVTHLEIYVDHPDNIQKRASQIAPVLSDKFIIKDWRQINNRLFQMVIVEQNVMFIILSLIILIAAFNILSSLIMLVKDKNRDIAIMRTMGATQRNIMKIFFLTGSTIGVVGTTVGFIFGILFTNNIDYIRRFLESLSGQTIYDAEIYFLTKLPSKVDPTEVVLIVFMALSLTFLASLYPAWKAAKLDPVEALRQ